MDELDKYRHMWTTQRDEYLLVQYVDKFTGVTNYMIYEIKSRGGMLMEDGKLEIQIIEEMLKNGVKVIDKLPKRGEDLA